MNEIVNFYRKLYSEVENNVVDLESKFEHYNARKLNQNEQNKLQLKMGENKISFTSHRISYKLSRHSQTKLW